MKTYNARRRPSNVAPKLSYEDAMSRYLVTTDGVIFRVRTTPTNDFTRWIRAITALQYPDVAQKLTDLDYASSIDRWYALNILMEHNIAVPLYQSYDAAYAALQGK